MSGTQSIGEVLHSLEAEFPDITISKIRFLESQGLLNPQRTASGYRKFADADVHQLRWVLVQQRDNFLPLRVIKQRLESGDWDAEPANGQVAATAPTAPAARAAAAPTASSAQTASSLPTASSVPSAGAGSPAATAASTSPRSSVAVSATTAGERSEGTPTAPTAPAAAAPVRTREPLDRGPGEMRLAVDELATAAELEIAEIRQLQKFGVLEPVVAEPAPIFDGDALIIAKAAATFMSRGLEARHLKSWKLAADREADMLSQITQPLARSAGASGEGDAVAVTNELMKRGNDMREAMLRRSLRTSLGLD